MTDKLFLVCVEIFFFVSILSHQWKTKIIPRMCRNLAILVTEPDEKRPVSPLTRRLFVPTGIFFY